MLTKLLKEIETVKLKIHKVEILSEAEILTELRDVKVRLHSIEESIGRLNNELKEKNLFVTDLGPEVREVLDNLHA